MKCRTCQDKGMLLQLKTISEHEVEMVVVTCDCCGGWSVDGIDCENCIADSEGRPRPNMWVDDEHYDQALKEGNNILDTQRKDFMKCTNQMATIYLTHKTRQLEKG